MNYRGILQASIVTVLEGDGKEIPYQEKMYVICPDTTGKLVTIGTVTPLTEEEKTSVKRLVPLTNL